MKNVINYLNISYFIKAVNKNFWVNFYLFIILLLFPIILTLINYYTNNNLINFVQTIPQTLLINTFLIGFLLIPIVYFIMSKSAIIKITKNNYKIKANLLLAIIFYYSIIWLISIIYGIIIIFLFGFKNVEFATVTTSGKWIHNYNDYIFGNNYINSYYMGIENYPPINWWLLILGCVIAFYFWVLLSVTISLCFHKITSFLFFIICYSLISILFGGLIVNLTFIKTSGFYGIIAYFTACLYPILFTYGLVYGLNFNEIPIFISNFDIDYSYPLYDRTSMIICIIVIFLVYLICTIIIFIFIIKNDRRKYYFKYKKHLSFGNDDQIIFSLKYIFSLTKYSINVKLKRNEIKYIKLNHYKKIIRIIRNLNRRYILDYFSKNYNALKSSIYLLSSDESTNNDLSLGAIKKILQIKKNNNEKIDEFIEIYLQLRNTINKDLIKTNNIDDYLVKLAFLLNAGISGLIIEIFNIYDNNLIQMIEKIAKSKNMSILFLICKK